MVLFSIKKQQTPNVYLHEGVNATNPNGMACRFNKYFECASNNNTGVSSAVPDIDEYKTCLCQIYFLQNQMSSMCSPVWSAVKLVDQMECH